MRDRLPRPAAPAYVTNPSRTPHTRAACQPTGAYAAQRNGAQHGLAAAGTPTTGESFRGHSPKKSCRRAGFT